MTSENRIDEILVTIETVTELTDRFDQFDDLSPEEQQELIDEWKQVAAAVTAALEPVVRVVQEMFEQWIVHLNQLAQVLEPWGDD